MMIWFLLIVIISVMVYLALKDSNQTKKENSRPKKILEKDFSLEETKRIALNELDEGEILSVKKLKENIFLIGTQTPYSEKINHELGIVTSEVFNKIMKIEEKRCQILILLKTKTSGNISITVEVWNEGHIIDENTKAIILSLNKDEITPEESTSYAKSFTETDFMELKSTEFDSKYLYPRKDLEPNGHLFYGKKVVITGGMESFPFREELAKLLWEIGADVDRAIGKNTDFAIVGSYNVGPRKMDKIIAQGIRIIREKELLEIFPNRMLNRKKNER